MADVAEDLGQVIEPVAADQLKEAVKEPAKDEVAEAVPAEKAAEPAEASTEEVKEAEENGSEEPKENGTSKDEKVAENGNTNGSTEDPERKRKSEVGDEADGVVSSDGVSAEKKAKLEEKSEEGVAEASSNGESEVAA